MNVPVAQRMVALAETMEWTVPVTIRWVLAGPHERLEVSGALRGGETWVASAAVPEAASTSEMREAVENLRHTVQALLGV